MADGSTPNYAFTLPEVGASRDSWGAKLNANWTLADTLLNKSGDPVAGTFLPLTGGTIDGDVYFAQRPIISNNAPYLFLDELDQLADARVKAIGLANGNFVFQSRTDDLGTPVTIAQIDKDGGLAGDTSVVLRAAGDARYLQIATAGNTYLSKTEAASTYLKLTGGTVTGAISWASDPTNGNHLARKSYVDAQVATQLSQSEADARYLRLTGGTVTGAISWGSDPSSGNHLTRKTYVDAQVATRLTTAQVEAVGDARYFRLGAQNDANLYIGTTNSNPATNNVLGIAIVTGNYISVQRNNVGLYVGRGDSATNNTLVQFRIQGVTRGSIDQSGSGISYVTSSDYRLKTVQGGIVDAVDRIRQVNPVKFTFTDFPAEAQEGFLAHEVQAVAPYAVKGEKDGPDTQMLDYSKLVALLWAAVQELDDRLSDVEAAA